jgi:hypothetical protein
MALEKHEAMEALVERLFTEIEGFGGDYIEVRDLMASMVERSDYDVLEKYFARAIGNAKVSGIIAYYPSLPFKFPTRESLGSCNSLKELEQQISFLYEILRFLKLKNGQSDFRLNEAGTDSAVNIYSPSGADEIANEVGGSISKLLFSGTSIGCNERFSRRVSESIQRRLGSGIVPNFVVEFGFIEEFEPLQRAVLLTRMRIFAKEMDMEFVEEDLLLQETRRAMVT